MSKPVYTKTDQTRLAGVERRVTFLERRSQTPEPDEYGGGDGGGFGDYFAAQNHQTNVAATSDDYISWGTAHSSGITHSGDTITIGTAGTYEILAAGMGLVGPATTPSLEALLMINGSGGDILPAGWTGAISPVDIPSGRTWQVSLALLDQRVLASSDDLQIAVANHSSAGASFNRWRIVIQQLE